MSLIDFIIIYFSSNFVGCASGDPMMSMAFGASASGDSFAPSPAENVPVPNVEPEAPAAQAAQPQEAPPVADRDDDWLGMIHNILSFILTFSVIYFYSSFERFLVIFGIAFVLMAYHNGWLTLQRRQVNNNNNVPPRQPAEAGAAEPGGDAGEPNEAARPPAPPAPNIIQTVITFIFTFFTSLIPDRPRAVN